MAFRSRGDQLMAVNIYDVEVHVTTREVYRVVVRIQAVSEQRANELAMESLNRKNMAWGKPVSREIESIELNPEIQPVLVK